MIAERYKPEHYAQVKGWWEAYGQPVIPEASLPKVGFIVQGLAAGFLYQTDSDLALAENFITDPVSYWADRSAALDAILEAITAYATQSGFRHVLGLTTSQAMYERCLRFGFRDNGTFQVLNFEKAS